MNAAMLGFIFKIIPKQDVLDTDTVRGVLSCGGLK